MMLNKKTDNVFFIVLVLVFCIGICLIHIKIRPVSIPIEQESTQQIIPLTFDQRVAHMQKCFDAAEKITTLAWGESTGSITIQLYLDTIDEIGKED